jgi:hypothetical protein
MTTTDNQTNTNGDRHIKIHCTTIMMKIMIMIRNGLDICFAVTVPTASTLHEMNRADRSVWLQQRLAISCR